VQVLPHGAAPDAAALAGLRIVLAAALGDGVQLSVAPASTHGDEDGPAAAPPQGTTLRLALAELGATPEDDSHGRWLKALRRAAPALPPVLLVDESAFVARLGTLPARVAERRTLWQRWAAAQALPLCVVRLTQPDPHESAAALHEALLA
jgi:hypothetical protein